MGTITAIAARLGIAQEKIDALPAADAETLDELAGAIESNPHGKWGIYQRGFWVNGADDFATWLKAVAPFTMAGRYEQIRCPTLVTYAHRDPLGQGAPAFHQRLKCNKSLVEFTTAEGAGQHCEILNRSLFNRVAFDWLDGIMRA